MAAVPGKGLTEFTNFNSWPCPVESELVLFMSGIVGEGWRQAWKVVDKLALLDEIYNQTLLIVWPGSGYITARYVKSVAARQVIYDKLRSSLK
jgi:hypothetical protein